MQSMTVQTYQITVSAATYQQLQLRAEREKMSVSKLVELLLERELTKLERTQAVQVK